MRQGMVGVVLAALAAAGGVNLDAQSASGAVRPEDGALHTLIAEGVERSQTFRDLITLLDTTDVVVYVRFSPCAGRVPACLLWVSPSPGARRLLIKLDRFAGSEDSLTALLAHELHHATEVASSPEIRDLASFQKAFEERGWKGTHGFETQQAKNVNRKVLTELAAQRATAKVQRKDPGR
ncbi:MAG TPA: hypothetical protein VM791_16330 [Vicinamibacterales bacterium]|jgi:hypothetical protein|nr:hypothetical protein [Vicinamibacterales bacterium]